jgi:hypothetical protein
LVKHRRRLGHFLHKRPYCVAARAVRSIGGDEHGRLGNTILLAIVGLLEATLDGDDTLWARHLELEVAVVGDGHELGKARSIEDGVVDTGEVDDLKGGWLLTKVVRLAEGDVEPDAPEGYDFLPAWSRRMTPC